MGRIKPLTIKRTAKKLLQEFPAIFTDKFKEKKEILKKILDVDKKTRNSIAGYIARLKKKHAKQFA